MKKKERADTNGDEDSGADDTDGNDKSIASHAKDHPHEGHDGTQAEEHSLAAATRQASQEHGRRQVARDRHHDRAALDRAALIVHKFRCGS